MISYYILSNTMNQEQLITKNQQINPNLLICVTGSVAAIKLPILFNTLKQHFNIKVIITEHASKFISAEDGEFFQNSQLEIYRDQMQWRMWNKRSDPVLHIQLRKWAHCMLIAPLSANTLAKITHGQADNLVTLVCRAWNMKIDQTNNSLIQPIFICPAMNTMMWEHPITAQQLKILQKWGYTQVGPIEKKLMCGQMGNGAMAEVQEIKKILLQWKNSSNCQKNIEA